MRRWSGTSQNVIYREYTPSPACAPLIEGFWSLSGIGPAAAEPVYPDGCTELIFNLGEPGYEVGGSGDLRQPRHFLYGQIDRRIRLRNAADTSIVAVRLRPWGATMLLGVPGRELAGRSVELDAVSPALLRRLLPALEDDAAPGRRIGRLDAALAGWIRERSGAEPSTARVARYLLQNPAATVSEVSRLTGWSLRTAQRRFAADIGLGPKRFVQVSRFVRFLTLLENEPTAGLSELAVAAGYYDQSHLHRDLRRFTGTTPARFRDRRTSHFDSLYGRERLTALVAP